MSVSQPLESDRVLDQAKELALQHEIKTFIQSEFPAFQTDLFSADTPLLEGGAIDSLGVIELVAFLEEKYGVEFDDDDFETENLETLTALTRLVISKTTR